MLLKAINIRECSAVTPIWAISVIMIFQFEGGAASVNVQSVRFLDIMGCTSGKTRFTRPSWTWCRLFGRWCIWTIFISVDLPISMNPVVTLETAILVTFNQSLALRKEVYVAKI